MLRRLEIQNIALVERQTLEFDVGMSVLTGETGGGKSIIVNALSLALGERADKSQIRHGEETATVRAVFDVTTMPRSYHTQFAPWIIDGAIAVERELAVDGASKVKINGAASTVTLLRELTDPLVEILSQHANQQLMDESNHLAFLDRFGKLDAEREHVGEFFDAWQASAKKLHDVRNRREQLQKERELLLFQQEEIEKAQLSPGEEEELNNERRKLDSARELMASADKVATILSGEEPAVDSMLAMVVSELDDMASIDTTLTKLIEEAESARIALEELRRSIEQYGNSLEDDPVRLDEVNVRLDEIYSLKKKYGGSEEAVLQTLASIHDRLQNMPDTDELIDHLERETERHWRAYTAAALALTEKRRTVAKSLRKAVEAQLKDLAIEEGTFELELLYELADDGVILDGRGVAPCRWGLENGRILFSANKGEPAKPLVKVASGGEISRVLLSIKAAEHKSGQISHSLMVFDEVDTGIGGRTAEAVGRKIADLASSTQVLVITHLHQIARLAEHHYVAEKVSAKKRALIHVARLDGAGVDKELERMVALPEGT